MKKKFLHEHHNRQDKRLNPDYVEHLAFSRKETSLESFRNDLEEKEAFMREFDFAFYFSMGRKLRLDWNVHKYAEVNGLDAQADEVKKSFDQHLQIAKEDHRQVVNKIRNSKKAVKSTCDGLRFARTIRIETKCEILLLRDQNSRG